MRSNSPAETKQREEGGKKCETKSGKQCRRRERSAAPVQTVPFAASPASPWPHPRALSCHAVSPFDVAARHSKSLGQGFYAP